MPKAAMPKIALGYLQSNLITGFVQKAEISGPWMLGGS
jgi:hypothetical protein